jgi:hypothetical protein
MRNTVGSFARQTSRANKARDGRAGPHLHGSCAQKPGALAFLVLGIAVSMIAFLLIVMLAVAIAALVAWSFQPRRA